MKYTHKRARTLAQRKEVLDRLLKLWEKVGDWRLGQLIFNFYTVDRDIFHIEDFDLIAVLEKKGKAR